MASLSIFAFLCLQLCSANELVPNYAIYDDPQYKLLPPLFRMENFKRCIAQERSFCEIEIELRQNPKSAVWPIVEETLNDSRRYLPRNKLRRALCMDTQLKNNIEQFSQGVLERIDYEIQPLNLSATVLNFDCTEAHAYFTLYDAILALVVACFGALSISSTYTDWTMRKTGQKVDPSSLTAAFSALSNWDKFCKLPTNPDYQRLKSFQGMRCIIMLSIVMGHSLYSHMYGYLDNPDTIEQHIYLYGMQMFINMGMFQVQIFLLMSGFLLALQVLTINSMFKAFSLKQMFLLIVNRFLRLVPVVGTMIAFHTSSIPLLILKNAPLASKLIQRTENCQRNWWKTVLFIHNNEAADKMCESGTWYMGVDSQMYALSLLIMYVIMRKKLGIEALLKVALFFITLYACFLVYFNTELFCRITPERLQFGQAERTFEFTLLYTSTLSSASTFIIGIIFGWYYYENKDLKLNKLVYTVPWFCMFFLLPWLVLHLVMYEYDSRLQQLFGAIIKPLFASGIGVGLLGMAYGLGGPIKKLFELRIFEYFANITFSLYIFHFDVVFPRSLFMDTPIYLTVGGIMVDQVVDLIASIGLGFVTYLTIELPWSNLIKMAMKGTIEREKSKIQKKD